MSEASDRSFDPTPSRLARARREGDVALSADLSSAAGFTAAACAAAVCVPQLARVTAGIVFVAVHGDVPEELWGELARWTLAVPAAALLASVAVAAAQMGGLQPRALSFSWKRLDPVDGARRMFSRESLAALLRSMCALVAATAIVAGIARTRLTIGASVAGAAAATWRAALVVAIAIGLVGMIFGGLDLAIALRRRFHRLRMSLHEMRRDHKENEGDPLVRERRRGLHRAILKGALRRVRDAAFVLANPTHVALAFEYAPPDVPVPRVLVRAAGELALRVREYAIELGIPVVENVTLSRRLYAVVDSGDLIPPSEYVAVAEVVAALLRSGVLVR
ncbi:MAG: EscU/YscU/HrcU family type III secretion system export apparatus switch protein [Candidatus Eremiobacteraeota bacterium]|nr:EscU/YscU/HrcU family type III secretion system export apparatus switch protein [Candidatus Eremiobacteraeota bacterium]